MISISKIRFFLITLTLTITFVSCNKDNDVIPYSYVNFSININDPQFMDLISIGGSITVNRTTIGPGAAGFDDNGIIIHAGVNEFFAYDRTCPHDYTLDGQSVQVYINPDNSLYAICPRCSTSYALPAGGTPSSGDGRYPLKNYKTNFDSRNIWVSNY